MKYTNLCSICGSSNIILVNTYKHRWVCCKACGCASSTRKDKYLFSTIHPVLLKSFPWLRRLLPKSDTESGNSTVFDYMASEEHVEAHECRGLFEKFMTTMIYKYGIDVNGKQILDISGGNGSFAKELERHGAIVTMTEYNEKAVLYAKNRYHIEAIRFDFNKDAISHLLRARFDIVLLRAAIMFCLDIRKLLSDLKGIIHRDTIIIVHDSVWPTLRTLIEWQLDDYIVLRLYKPETLIDIFAEQGFELVVRDERGLEECLYINSYRTYGLRTKAFNLLYAIPAALKYKNRDTLEKASHFIFKPMYSSLD